MYVAPLLLQGYITMAQARHAMGGPKAVSSLQYDSMMTPLVSIEVTEELGSYEDFERKREESSRSFVEFKVHRIVPGKPVIRSRLTAEDADSADKGVFLRQRRKREEVQSATESEIKPQGVEDVTRMEDATRMMSSWRLGGNEEEGGEGTFESREDLKDPLKWFGVLVPQALRRSQQHFIAGLHVCVLMSRDVHVHYSAFQILS